MSSFLILLVYFVVYNYRFDSQHLCCVERYLEIYKPFTCMPEELQKREGAKGIAMFKLRSGDLIDRFGQAQRTVLCKYK